MTKGTGLGARDTGLRAGRARRKAEGPEIAGTPLLKWVGGKRQLLPRLRRFYPASFGRYIEPFFGSGAVFFDLHASGRLAGHDVVLVDSNADLIGCYEAVRDEPDAVAAALDRARRGARARADARTTTRCATRGSTRCAIACAATTAGSPTRPNWRRCSST